MKFTVFNKSTGKIEKVISCSPELIGIQYNSAIEDVIEGEYSDDSFYIQNGQAVPIGNAPSDAHVFDFDTKQWVDPRTPETQWEAVRMRRNALLAQSDWTQLPDVPLATKEAWAAYRQALRDITEQPDPLNIVWPEPPA